MNEKLDEIKDTGLERGDGINQQWNSIKESILELSKEVLQRSRYKKE